MKSENLTINYSVGTVFNSSGIGYTAYNAVLGIYRRQWLKSLYVSSFLPSEIPAEKIRVFGWQGKIYRYLASKIGSRGYDWHDRQFDQFVASSLTKADIFHGWNQHCLSSLKKAKSLGSKTVLERASSHLLKAKNILEHEYRKYQVNQPVVDSNSLERGLAEFELTDYCLVPSDFAYQSFLDQGYPKQKLKKIPFGVDLEKFAPAARIEPQAKIRFLFVGQVGLRKGVQYLLEAWKKLHLKQAELLLAGVVQNDIRKLLNERNLPEGVSIKYYVDVRQAYNQADIFVFPSLEEGMALVTLEAMASGLAVITTFNSGSVITDRQDGLEVKVSDSTDLAEKMQELYEDKELRHKLGKQARKTAENYSWDHYRTKLLEFYQEISK